MADAQGMKGLHATTIRSPAGASAEILSLGGIIRTLNIPLGNGTTQDVVLGYDNISGYEQDTAYMGAIVGRYANRIGNGRYSHAGLTHDLDRNEKSATTLHGGRHGFSGKTWTVIQSSAEAVVLQLISRDGDQGFPGTVNAKCKYWFSGPRELSFTFTATTDKPTPVNLSQHAYFNLDGTSDLRHHQLQVFADSYTPTDDLLIPTGEIAKVDGTRHDFRQLRELSGGNLGFDCNFALDPPPDGTNMRPAATLRSRLSGLEMHLATTKPGLQYYDGHMLSASAPGKRGMAIGRHAGLCLEPQFFPDSPNKPEFPNCFLSPGEIYQHTTTLSFRDLD